MDLTVEKYKENILYWGIRAVNIYVKLGENLKANEGRLGIKRIDAKCHSLRPSKPLVRKMIVMPDVTRSLFYLRP
jgi:hypothetical protein